MASNMDKELCQFYYEVMKKLLRDFTDFDSIKLLRLMLPLLRAKYKGRALAVGNVHSFPSSSTPLHRLSYLYECSTCASSLIVKHLGELLKSDCDSAHKLLQRKRINICCLAGSPGVEAVAIVKLFTDKWQRKWDDQAIYMKFHVNFVDVDDGWKEFAEVVLKALTEFNNQWHTPKVTFSFEVVDPFIPLRVETAEIFQSADIIMMMKNFYDISDISVKKLDEMLKMTFENMKPESLFFCLDSSSGEYVKQLSSLLQKFPCFHNVYQYLYGCHTISLNSIQEHMDLYRTRFGRDLNTSYCLISVAAWMRASKDSTRKATWNEMGVRLKDKSQYQPPVNQKERKKVRKQMLFFHKSVDDLINRTTVNRKPF